MIENILKAIQKEIDEAYLNTRKSHQYIIGLRMAMAIIKELS